MTAMGVVHGVSHFGSIGAHPRLLAHVTADAWDFARCGTTSGRRPCQAWSVSGARQCPKNAAVVLSVVLDQARLGVLSVPLDLALCGGHFDVHRAGKSLAVVL